MARQRAAMGGARGGWGALTQSATKRVAARSGSAYGNVMARPPGEARGGRDGAGVAAAGNVAARSEAAAAVMASLAAR